MTRLEDWATTYCEGQAYQAPEIRDHLHLIGRFGGKRKLTSRVIKVEGRVCTTKSGSVYVLGRPSRVFMAFLREHGLTYDPKQPVKVP